MDGQKIRMLNGELYKADDPELVADRRRARLLAEAFNSPGLEDAQRRQLLGQLFGSLGDATVLEPPLQCDYGYTTSIGHRCFVNYGLVLLDCAPVDIGDDVQIGPNVQLLTATHPLDAEIRRQGWEAAAPITIRSGAWLGGGVIVCPGVTIGRDSVIGAGSVVTRDVPAAVLAVGTPARVVRSLS
jgi:maltose O-acetyltransferase